jgi:hypothetical protein
VYRCKNKLYEIRRINKGKTKELEQLFYNCSSSRRRWIALN